MVKVMMRTRAEPDAMSLLHLLHIVSFIWPYYSLQFLVLSLPILASVVFGNTGHECAMTDLSDLPSHLLLGHTSLPGWDVEIAYFPSSVNFTTVGRCGHMAQALHFLGPPFSNRSITIFFLLSAIYPGANQLSLFVLFLVIFGFISMGNQPITKVRAVYDALEGSTLVTGRIYWTLIRSLARSFTLSLVHSDLHCIDDLMTVFGPFWKSNSRLCVCAGQGVSEHEEQLYVVAIAIPSRATCRSAGKKEKKRHTTWSIHSIPSFPFILPFSPSNSHNSPLLLYFNLHLFFIKKKPIFEK